MRKKSHVSLSRYLLDHIDSELLENHRKAFIVGSVLPDCKPSFVTTKHNMEETFDMVCEFIRKLTVNSDDYKNIDSLLPEAGGGDPLSGGLFYIST